MLGLVNDLWNFMFWKLPEEIPPARNLTHRAVQEGIPLLGRDNVIDQVFQAFSLSGPSVRAHPLLVGPAAETTDIMKEVARRIALRPETLKLPQSLVGGFVYFTTAADLLSNNPMEGTLKFDQFFRQIRTIKDRAIVAIDEVHTFFNGTHRNAYGQKFKAIMDTSMNGIPYLLLATTVQEYTQLIQTDEAVARRLYVIRVN